MNNRIDEIDRNINTFKRIVKIIVPISFLLIGLGIYLKFDNEITTFGELGDFISGTAVASFTLVSILLIYLAFLSQQKQIIIQEIEIKENKKDTEEQLRNLKLQRFENHFFQLLALHIDTVRYISSLKVMPTGIEEGFDSYSKIYVDFRNMYYQEKGTYSVEGEKIKVVWKKFEEKYYSNIIKYMSSLDSILRFILKNKDSITDINFYINIIRDHLTTAEALLIFYYCIGIDVSNEKHFKPIIYNTVKDSSLLLHIRPDKMINPSAHKEIFEKLFFVFGGYVDTSKG